MAPDSFLVNLMLTILKISSIPFMIMSLNFIYKGLKKDTSKDK